MSVVIEQNSEQLKASLAFHSRVELHSICLLEAKIERLQDWKKLESPIKIEVEHTAKQAHLGEDDAEIATAFRFRAVDSSRFKTEALSVECTYQASYSLAPEYKPSAAEIEAFQLGNAVFNAWPFFREFVQTNVARMGLPVPPVPFLRLISKQESPNVDTVQQVKPKLPKPKKNKKTQVG